MSRIIRLGRYFTWTVADQFISLGVPRLVLFPILATMMTDAAFGSFVIVLGAIQMVGLSPSNGLIGFIIRDFVKTSEDEQAILTRTTIVLSFVVMVPIGLAYVLGANAIAGLYGENAIVARMLPIMALFLLLTNLVETSLAGQRVRRKFGRMALVHGAQSGLLFLAIPLYGVWQEAGIATAYLVAGAGALLVSAGLERRAIFQRPIFRPSVARAAFAVWPAFSLAAVISLSAGYLDRMLLGYWWSPADVKPFFAAVSMASLIAIPGTLLANLVLSLLGGLRDAGQLNRRFHILYALGVCGASVVVLLVGLLLGRPLLDTFYPSAADDAMKIWHYAMAGFAVFNIGTLLRPFVSKFLSPKILPIIATISFLARLIPLILLIPSKGAIGAAQGLLIGWSVTASLWLCLYVKNFVLADVATSLESIDDPPLD